VWPGDDVIVLVATGNARRDAKRVNRCVLRGWRVFLVPAADWQSGATVRLVRRALGEG
jgi:hypothetical protein